MFIDYHMHTERDDFYGECPYTRSRLEEYLRTAEKRGVAEIGITEHCHRFTAFWPMMRTVAEGPGHCPDIREWLMASCKEELERYVAFLVDAQAAGLPVKIGVEVDYVPGWEDFLREVLAPYPWDYLLGSVHYLGRWPIDYSPQVGWPEQDVTAAYEAYFRTLIQAAQSGLFDILAHPDLIKKFGHRAPPEAIASLLDDTADAMAAAGLCAEVSTAGLHRPVREIYPGQDLLSRLAQRNVPITLGSDAHEPERVGLDLDKAVDWALQAGITHLCVFEKRVPQQVPLLRA